MQFGHDALTVTTKQLATWGNQTSGVGGRGGN